MCEWVAEKRQTGMVKGQKLLKARLEVLEGHDCPHKRLFFFYYFKFTPSKAIMSLICKALLGVKENEKKTGNPVLNMEQRIKHLTLLPPYTFAIFFCGRPVDYVPYFY